MNKILFAINFKEAEAAIEDKIKDSYEVAGIAQYKEMISTVLQTTEADTLLIIDSLPGGGDFLNFIKTIRENFPLVRIICIVKEFENKKDPFLATLVSLGIYDIISHNRMFVDDIVSYILNPRTFKDAAQYYNGVPDKLVPTPTTPVVGGKKRGGIFAKPNASKDLPSTFEVPVVPLSSGPAPDLDAIRAAIEEKVSREAQKNIDKITKDLATKQNAEMQKVIDEKEATISELTSNLNIKTSQGLVDSNTIRDRDAAITSLQKELKTLKDSSSRAMKEYEQQLLTVKSTENPEWFKNKVQEWDEKDRSYQKEIQDLLIALDTLQVEKQALIDTPAQCNNGVIGQIDLSGKDDMLVILPDDPNGYKELSGDKVRKIIFMGSKHGVGNSTIALNTAVALSMRGHKTLYIEFNNKFPMIPEFFEFIDIRTGIDTAITGLSQRNNIAVDAAIIKPYGVATDRKQLMDAYKQLPGALHFMFFTNAYLAREREQGNEALETCYLDELFEYLINELKYSYIVIDAQPDDVIGKYLLENSDKIADRLLLTCTQDPHSIATTGILLNDIVHKNQQHVLNNTRIIVNKFKNDSIGPAIPKISKWLKLPASKFCKISDDPNGYMKAACSAVPYVSAKGMYFKEYTNLGGIVL